MPKFSQEFISKYSIDQIFDLVMDIEKYPQFLPWCAAARIVEKNDEETIADLIIKYKAFTEHYRSKVVGVKALKNANIDVDLVDGPFKYLTNEWNLKKTSKGTKIRFFVDFEFKSGLLDKLIGVFFSKACEKMVQAFEDRADKLYK